MARKRDLQSEIEELFSELWQVPRFAGLRQGFRPRVDCYTAGTEITVVVEIPGVDPASIQIDATPRTLVISGERRRPRVGGAVYQILEIDHGPFQRTLEFSQDVDVERATASYRDGLLTVVMPVATTPPRALKVPIEVEARP